MDVPEEEVYDVYDWFREIRELALLEEDDVGQMWDNASKIRLHARRILLLLAVVQEAQGAEVKEPPANSNAGEIFRWIHHYAVGHCLGKGNKPA